jgi:tetratricopeptide (TPR) repeat protein
VGGITLRDFSDTMPDKAFPSEYGRDVKMAYTYKTESGSVRSLFQVVWTNPAPEKEVDYIEFKTTENAIIALFSVTELIEGESMTSSTATRDVKLASEFYNTGLEHYKKKEYATAIKSFEKAIKVDYNNYSSYLLLGDIYKTSKDYLAAEQILNRLIEIAPDEVEAYTKLGEIYEIEGKKKEALNIYRKSFKVDKNQPWIMHAIERLKNEIK